MIANARDIIDNADVLHVIGRRVSLRRNGSDQIGRCPFHAGGQERTPSLHVRSDKGWYCHGPCKRGGNVIDFVMDFENIDFVEAVEVVAAETGQRVQYDQQAQETTDRPRRADLYEAIRSAADHYQAQLADHQQASEYADSRGLTDDIRSRWEIGYARGNHVQEAADPELLETAGVLKRSQKNNDLYDPLAGRLIITLHDTTGRPVAFCGRSLPSNESAAKYLNTADTPIYKKGEHLYGYHAAVRILRNTPEEDRLAPVVVEGQLKALACLESGIPAVAPGGSTLTERQALLLQRLHTSTRLAYDADKAGDQGTQRAIRELRKLEQTVYISRLEIPEDADPDTSADPDELFAAGRPIAYTDMELTPWAINHLLTEPPHTAAWARQITQTILPLIDSHPDPVVTDVEYRTLADATGISVDALVRHQVPAGDQAKTCSAAKDPDPNTAKISTKLTPARVMCVLALQWQPCTADAPASWTDALRSMDLPVALLGTLSTIYRIRRVAALRNIPITTAIRQLNPQHTDQLLYWCQVELPFAVNTTSFTRTQHEACDEEEKRRWREGEYI